MEEKLNVAVLRKVRSDMGWRPETIYVPWDMPDSEVVAKFPKEAAAGTVKKLQPARGQLEPTELEKGLAAKPKEYISVPPAPIQSAWVSTSDSLAHNFVGPGISGPARVVQVSIRPTAMFDSTIDYYRACIHASMSPDVGPFSGDLSFFNSFNHNAITAQPEGDGILDVVPYAEQTPTGAYSNDRVTTFFMDQIIPFGLFYLNFSIQSINIGGAWIFTVVFGQVQVEKGAISGFLAIQQRPAPAPAITVKVTIPPAPKPSVEAVAAPVVAAPVPVPVAPPKPAPKIETMQFKNYQSIKEFEAVGNKVVWSTIRNTGQGYWGMPLEVSVVRKP